MAQIPDIDAKQATGNAPGNNPNLLPTPSTGNAPTPIGGSVTQGQDLPIVDAEEKMSFRLTYWINANEQNAELCKHHGELDYYYFHKAEARRLRGIKEYLDGEEGI